MKSIASLLFLTIIFTNILFAQAKKASDLATVSEVNTWLGTNLIYDANSIVNKSAGGKFEVRFTDTKSYEKVVGVNLLESKIYSGFDVLKYELDNAQKEIAQTGKAIGKYTKIVPFPKAGANAFYMIAPRNDFSAESFSFKFRKGDYIVSFFTMDISTDIPVKKLEDIYKALSAKL